MSLCHLSPHRGVCLFTPEPNLVFFLSLHTSHSSVSEPQCDIVLGDELSPRSHIGFSHSLRILLILRVSTKTNPSLDSCHSVPGSICRLGSSFPKCLHLISPQFLPLCVLQLTCWLLHCFSQSPWLDSHSNKCLIVSLPVLRLVFDLYICLPYII